MHQNKPESAGETYPVPDVGAWDLEMLHWMDPTSEYMTEVYPLTMPEGMRQGCAHYGLLLDSLDMVFVNSFLYVRSRGVGAPPSAVKSPPRWLFKILAALHPEIRRRVARADRVFADKIWQVEARQWREVDRPATVEQGNKLQAVEPTELDATALVAHLQACDSFVRETIIRHHRLVFCVVIPLMDFVVHVQDWTGASQGEIFPVFQGASPQSSDAADELQAIRLAVDADARQQLAQSLPAAEVLAQLASGGSAFAKAVEAYVARVGYRLLSGYDVSHRYALEVPEVLLAAIRSAVNEDVDAYGQQNSARMLAGLRQRVPAQHQAEFDQLLAEARDTYGIRDERIFIGDAWATGLMRRAILAAGKRLVEADLLTDPEQLVDARLDEMVELLEAGAVKPSDLAQQVMDRYRRRRARHIDQAPGWLGAPPPAPPPVEWIPKPAQRVARAMDGYINNLFEADQVSVADSAAASKRVSGAAAGPGNFQGPARIIRSAEELGKVVAGDVVITVSTSPAFNVIMPLAGALVTNRGGLLSHAAIVAREYGIPAVVGARGATELFADGDQVSVNGDTGEVTLA